MKFNTNNIKPTVMKNIGKITWSLLTALLLAFTINAQDSRFSQPTNSPLTLNPSMMALSTDFRAILNYRNQWGGIDKGYQTYAGSVMYPFYMKAKKDTNRIQRLDIGVNVLYEQAGAYKRVNANLNIAYGLHLNAANLVSAAINVGLVNHSINWNDQTFDEQYIWGSFDSDNPTGENPLSGRTNADVGFGLLWHFAPASGKLQAFAGVSGFHLNQPNLSFTGGSSKLPSRYNFQGGVKILSKKLDFTPMAMYNIQGQFKALTAGFLLAYKFDKAGKIVAGSWFKEKEAIAVQLGYEHPYFGVHYSYDFGNSTLTRNTRGLMTHEVALILKWENKKASKGVAFF
jgi:type IX secretion system PorP/SprF family membrane protein